MKDETQQRGNSLDKDRLRSLIERVERLAEERKGLGDDMAAVFAEAKSDGYTPRYMKALIKLRAMKPSEREEDEAMMDLYLSAMDMARETPLFRYASAASHDVGARERLAEALMLLAPVNGEITVKLAGSPRIRLWRDDAGPQMEVVRDEDVAPPAAAPPSREPQAERPFLPDVDEEGAHVMGHEARRGDEPVTRNPFRWDDRRRAAWDLGWREEDGGDGMGPT